MATKAKAKAPGKEIIRASNVLSWGDPEARTKFDAAYDKRMKFYALRVPAGVIRAYKSKAGKEHARKVREFMAKVAGVELPDNEGES